MKSINCALIIYNRVTSFIQTTAKRKRIRPIVFIDLWVIEDERAPIEAPRKCIMSLSVLIVTSIKTRNTQNTFNVGKKEVLMIQSCGKCFGQIK